MMPEHISGIAAIEKACFSDAWSEALLEDGLESRFDTYFVWSEDGEVLGYGVLRSLAGEGEIQRIAVLPEARRRGIAGKLMEAMAEKARSQGVSQVTLEVRESNEAAQNLYKAYGFCQEAVRKGYYQNPSEDAVIMWNRRI